MKKFYYIVLILLSIILYGCGNEQNSKEINNTIMQKTDKKNDGYDEEIQENFQNKNVEFTDYNIEIYSDEYVNIVCNNITKNGIEFGITNNLQNNILSVNVSNVAVDGICPPSKYSDTGSVDIEPGTTMNALYGADINFTDHKLMSVYFHVFNDNGIGIESIDIVDFDLGGTENIECEEPNGKLVHDSKFLGISYIGADEVGIRLRIANKMDEAVMISFDHPFSINDKEYDEYVLSATTLPSHSKSDYYIYVKLFEPDYVPESIESLICTGHISHGTTIENFNINSNIDVSAENVSQENDLNIVYNTYIATTTLTKSDLTGSMGHWSYNGLPLLSEDCDWIDDVLNKKETVNQGALYRKLAMCLEGFAIGNSWTSYAEYIIGFVPDSRDEFSTYVENAKEFIVTENPFDALMRKFETLNSVDGTFDGSSNTYEFFISDLTACAEELQISEEMLGYILALLDEYAPEVSFGDNTYTFLYAPYTH